MPRGRGNREGLQRQGVSRIARRELSLTLRAASTSAELSASYLKSTRYRYDDVVTGPISIPVLKFPATCSADRSSPCFSMRPARTAVAYQRPPGERFTSSMICVELFQAA